VLELNNFVEENFFVGAIFLELALIKCNFRFLAGKFFFGGKFENYVSEVLLHNKLNNFAEEIFFVRATFLVIAFVKGNF